MYTYTKIGIRSTCDGKHWLTEVYNLELKSGGIADLGKEDRAKVEEERSICKQVDKVRIPCPVGPIWDYQESSGALCFGLFVYLEKKLKRSDKSVYHKGPGVANSGKVGWEFVVQAKRSTKRSDLKEDFQIERPLS